jgi:tryptophanyl-tRNA synthetase
LLTCVTPKGMLNRAHAYKAAVDATPKRRRRRCGHQHAGLYMYPVLMAADILAFDAHKVPVGKRPDPAHRDGARSRPALQPHPRARVLRVPEAVIEEQVATLPGLDGRKMSKSYDNTIPLFARRRQAAARDHHAHRHRLASAGRAEGSRQLLAVYHLPRVCGRARKRSVSSALLDGIGWGDAKQVLVRAHRKDVAPMRERYEALIADPAGIESILQEGAIKARAIATPKIAALRDALGLRSASARPAMVVQSKVSTKANKAPRFASFRDADGSFRFRLFSAEGDELLLSIPFADPKAGGVLQKRIKAAGVSGVVLQIDALRVVLELDGEPVASSADYRDEPTCEAALSQLRQALDQLAATE